MGDENAPLPRYGPYMGPGKRQKLIPGPDRAGKPEKSLKGQPCRPWRAGTAESCVKCLLYATFRAGNGPPEGIGPGKAAPVKFKHLTKRG